jgi:hypothetical protein
MGTMTDDGAMPRRASGNGSVVGSSITSGGQSGSWLQSKMNVRRIVNQFLLSTEGRRDAAAQHTHYGAVHRDAGKPRAMRSSSAPLGACRARSRAPHALSSRFSPRFSSRFSRRALSREFSLGTAKMSFHRARGSNDRPFQVKVGKRPMQAARRQLTASPTVVNSSTVTWRTTPCPCLLRWRGLLERMMNYQNRL